MELLNRDKKYQRYKFVDYNGMPRGLKNVDDLAFAIQTAIDFQCEVIDTKIVTGNQIVYSAWDGWNQEYNFYNENESKRIMEGVNYG